MKTSVLSLTSLLNAQCGIYDNQASFMRLENNRYCFEQFAAVPSPYYLPRFMNCITYTLPALAEASALI